jgi:hypothetical protein
LWWGFFNEGANMLTERERKHIAKLIRREVGYFNGWSVSYEQVDKDCEAATKKIERYLKRKLGLVQQKGLL